MDISKFPSIVARPYLLAAKKDEQWKDLQRYTFENLMAYLACVAVSDLMNIYRNFRLEAVNEGEEGAAGGGSLGKVDALRNMDTLKRIGLEQMSLGKWAATLRETVKTLHEYRQYASVPELPKVLLAGKGNTLWPAIDKLISIRNKDAHGNPIAPDKLTAELTKRQELLDSILEQCGFLENYRVVYFDHLVLDAEQQKIAGKVFLNDGEESVLVDVDAEPPMNEIHFTSQNFDFFLPLRPLMLYAASEEGQSKQLAIYSKQLEKTGDKVHYIGVDGAVDISNREFDQKNNQNIVERWKHLNEVFSEEDAITPNLVGMLKVDSVMEVDDDNQLVITLDNRNSTALYNIKGTVSLSEQFQQIETEAREGVECHYDETNGTIDISVPEMANGEKVEVIVGFTAMKQAGVRVPSSMVSYSYYRTESDQESGKLSENDFSIDGVYIEVRDPKSPDKMVPIINIDRKYLPHDGDNIYDIRIGHAFLYEITLRNIGIGAARDVSIELIFPPEVELIEGNQTLLINLNPMEERSFRYLVQSRVPGQYRILLRDLSFFDYDGKKYLSTFTDDYSILVRSDVVRQFEFELAEAISDFDLDDDELDMIALRKKSMGAIYGDSVNEMYDKSLFDAAIRRVRDLVSGIAKQRGCNLQEVVVEESVRQTKITGNSARKSLIFSVDSVPFFGLDITEINAVKFHSIDSKILDKIHPFSYSPLFPDKTTTSFVLPNMIEYQEILSSKKINIKFLKKWINLALTEIDKKFKPWTQTMRALEACSGLNFSYANGDYQVDVESSCRQFYLETGINQIGVNLHRNKRTIWLYLTSRKDSSKFVAEHHKNKSQLKYYKNKSLSKEYTLKENPYKEGRLGYYRIETEKLAVGQAIEITKTSDEGIQAGIDNFLEIIRLHRLHYAQALFADEVFSQQENNVDLVSLTNDLYQKGFSFRRPVNQGKCAGIRMDAAIEVYPYHHFKFGQASRHDCIAFLDKYYKNWDLSVNFYHDIEDNALIEDCSNTVSIHNNWGRTVVGANRLFVLSKEKEAEESGQRFEVFHELLKKSVTHYQPGALSLWPSFIFNDMLSEYMQAVEGSRALLEYLLPENKKLSRLDEEAVKLSGIDPKDFKKLIRFNDNYQKKYHVLTPVVVDGSDVVIADEYLEKIKSYFN